MADSFSSVVRAVRLYASTAPLFLVQEWVNAAYKALCAERRWSFLRADGALTIAAARDLAAITVTQGSTSVTSAALFVAGDVGRQIRVGTYPYYTITAFTDTSTVTIDRAYGGTTESVAAQILDAYVPLPADFASFRTIADPYNRRPIPFWGSEDQILLQDPTRSFSGIPQAFVPAPPSPVTATLGQVRYEVWPVSVAARSYPIRYNRQEDNLQHTDTFTGVLKDGGQVLIEGALSFAAEWPGTPDLRNPYFNVQLAQVKRGNFLTGIQKLSLRDDEQVPDDVLPVDWSKYDALARTDQALRSSDATVADYY